MWQEAGGGAMCVAAEEAGGGNEDHQVIVVVLRMGMSAEGWESKISVEGPTTMLLGPTLRARAKVQTARPPRPKPHSHVAQPPSTIPGCVCVCLL